MVPGSCGFLGGGRLAKQDGAPTMAMRMSGPMRTANLSLTTCSPSAFITGSDFLVDGDVTAACRYGELAPKWPDSGSRCGVAVSGGLMRLVAMKHTI
jgi:hypothetical protein